jgi:hypothetical protein
VRPGVATLALGDRHPIARELAEVIAWSRPLQYQYMARFEGILYGPEHLSLGLLAQTADATGQVTAEAVAQPA